MTRTTHWEGRFHIGRHWARYDGIAGDNRPHRHFCAQLAWTSKGTVGIEGPMGHVIRRPLVAVEPNESHRLVPRRHPLSILYVEPTMSEDALRTDSSLQRHLSEAMASAPRSEKVMQSSPFWRGVWSSRPSRTEKSPRPMGLDPRIRAIVDASTRGTEVDHRHEDWAAMIGVSPSHLSHLFRDSVGISLRRFLLWCRLRRAALALRHCKTITEAAHRAGFSDSAHFNRVLSRAFGVTPSASLMRFSIQVDE